MENERKKEENLRNTGLYSNLIIDIKSFISVQSKTKFFKIELYLIYMFQVYSKVIQFYICTYIYILFQILLHDFREILSLH